MLVEPALMKHFADTVTTQELPRHVVCGVDAYQTIRIAAETGDGIDFSRPYIAAYRKDECMVMQCYFFSFRRFEIVDLFDAERMSYCSCNDIEDIKGELRKTNRNRQPLLLLSKPMEVSRDENDVLRILPRINAWVSL